MKRISLVLLLSLTLTGVSSWARSSGGGGGGSAGGVKLGLSYMMYNIKQNPQPAVDGTVSGTDSEGKQSYLDLKLGLSQSEIYYGLIYSTAGRDTLGLSSKRTMMGVTLGYHNSGFFLDGSYYLTGKKTDEFNSGDSLENGSGYGIDFGYDVMVGSNVYLGVQISYRDLSFGKYTPAGGTQVSTTWKQNELYPMLNLGIMF
jgi:hypothetical protein